MPNSGPIGNAVKLIGEMTFVPGTSELLDGNINSGVAHAAVGVAAGAVFGGPGVVLVAADSYAQSVSGKGLYAHLKDALNRAAQSQTGRETPHAEKNVVQPESPKESILVSSVNKN